MVNDTGRLSVTLRPVPFKAMTVESPMRKTPAAQAPKNRALTIAPRTDDRDPRPSSFIARNYGRVGQAGRARAIVGLGVQDAAGPRAGLSPPDHTSSHSDRFVSRTSSARTSGQRARMKEARMPARQFPFRPDLDQLRNQAKDLL